MPTSAAEDAKGGGLTGKGPTTVVRVWAEPGWIIVVGGGIDRWSDRLSSNLAGEVETLYGHKEVVLQFCRENAMIRKGRADTDVILEINRPHSKCGWVIPDEEEMVLDRGAQLQGVIVGIMAFDEIQETVVCMRPIVVGHLELTFFGEE